MKTYTLKKLEKEIKEARKDVKEGKIYSQEEIMKEFGILPLSAPAVQFSTSTKKETSKS